MEGLSDFLSANLTHSMLIMGIIVSRVIMHTLKDSKVSW